MHQLGLAFGSGQVAVAGQFPQQEVREGHGSGDEGFEGLLPQFPHVAVGVVLGGEKDETDGLVVGQGF